MFKLQIVCTMQNIYINIFKSGHLINWFVPTNFFKLLLHWKHNIIRYPGLSITKRNRVNQQKKDCSLSIVLIVTVNHTIFYIYFYMYILLIVAVEHFIYHIYMLCMKYMYLRFGHCNGESIIEKVHVFKIVKMKNA